MIATVNQIIHRIDDRQSRSHIGLKEELDVAMTCSLLQLDIILIRRGSRLFIGRYDRDVIVHQRTIKGRHIRAGRTIHEHRVKDVHLQDLVTEMLRIAILAMQAKLLPVIIQVNSFAQDTCFLGIRDADNIQFQPVLLHQFRALNANLLQQVTTHRTNTGNKKVQHFILRKEEGIVDRVQCLPQVFQLDHKRDIGLRRTLCTSDHADTGTS